MDRLLTTAEAAAHAGISKSWLEKQRVLGPGNGPAYIKIGRAVRYRPADLTDYFNRLKVG